MPRLILPACCLLLLSLTAARAEDAKPLATFPMGPDRMPFVTLSFGGKDYQCLIHTGASTTIFHETAREALGKAVGEHQGRLSTLCRPCLSGRCRFRMESRHFAATWATCARRRPVDGIVGMGILGKLGLTLDFDENVGPARTDLPAQRTARIGGDRLPARAVRHGPGAEKKAAGDRNR
ncbi:MAG: hypothetical protein U0836_11100 [Pirellulales bacterium]